VAAEEFQIGGPTSVRGYPPAEHAGDKGYYTSLEWSFPFYFVSKDALVPFREGRDNLYDSLRWVLFYDWATARLNRTEPGENKHQTLRGWGFGFRFNVRDDIACRVEFGYPLGKTPSDEDHLHPWIEFVSKF
jgi:hemolysin activation/secretion protein